jgi:hypothetical protein
MVPGCGDYDPAMAQSIASARLLALILALVGLIGCARNPQGPVDIGDLTITIENQNFTMTDGVGALNAAPGSAIKNTVRILGDPVEGDIDGDGNVDAALMIQNDPGGSGVFYYAVVAINDGGSYRASNALPLGDRIEPQSIQFRDQRFVYNYAVRKPGEAMDVRPSVERNELVRLDPATGLISAVS